MEVPVYKKLKGGKCLLVPQCSYAYGHERNWLQVTPKLAKLELIIEDNYK